MGKFFAFRTMITPAIIQGIFWLANALSMLVGLGMMLDSRSNTNVVGGFLLLFVGPLLIRIYCEVLILFFRIHQVLEEIRENTLPRPR